MSSTHSTSTLDALLLPLAIGDIDILNIDGGCRLSAPQTIHFYAWPIHHTPVIPEILNWASSCADLESFVRGGQMFGGGGGGVGLVDGEREDPNTTINRPSTANQEIAINIEWWFGSFVIFRGSGPVLLRNPIFVIFQRDCGGSGPPVPTTLWIHACSTWEFSTYCMHVK